MTTWQILIGTVVERKSQFEELVGVLQRQIDMRGLQDYVQIIYDQDNKEKSIGKKRQDLLEAATADYIVFFDDDDMPNEYYVGDIYDALSKGPDCVGMLIAMTTNSARPQVCCHSLKYKNWQNNVDGYNYVRNVTHFNPVRRSLALQAGFPDQRFGEDKDYSDRVTKLCHTEIFLDKFMFNYRYSTSVEFNKKYGIRK